MGKGRTVDLSDDVMAAVLRSEYFTARNASAVELVESSGRPASTVFQVRVHVDPEPELFWVKIRPADTRGSSRREYDFLDTAYRIFEPLEGLAVPCPVAYLADHDGLVTQHVAGVPLNRLVKKSLNRWKAPFADLAEAERHFERCGTWLATLHSHKLPSAETFDPDSLRSYVEARLKYLESKGALDSAFRARVVTYLDSQLVRLGPDAVERVWTHGDYAPYNVVVTPNRLTVLDPDIGGYYAELGNYCSRFEDILHFHRFTRSMSQSSGLIGPKVRARLAHAFLRGYEAAGAPPVDEGSAGFRAFELKYELLGVVGMEWPSLLARLVSGRSRIKRFRKWFERASSA